MFFSKRIGIVSAVLAGIALWRRQVEMRRHRLSAGAAKPNAVSTWEVEGGALRGSGSQLGPGPLK